LPEDSKSLTAPYFRTLTYADKMLTYAEKEYINFCRRGSASVPRASAFKTGVTSPTAVSGSNLASGFAGTLDIVANVQIPSIVYEF
jgi:hypothetical protein